MQIISTCVTVMVISRIPHVIKEISLQVAVMCIISKYTYHTVILMQALIVLSSNWGSPLTPAVSSSMLTKSSDFPDARSRRMLLEDDDEGKVLNFMHLKNNGQCELLFQAVHQSVLV